jgi:arylsulfatase A-like enzyme
MQLNSVVSLLVLARQRLRPVLGLLLGLAFTGVAAEARSKPNLLVIVADDMGFSDLGCYGGEIRTPNLDRLARNGLRFTQFYNTARCWPSRASILTDLVPTILELAGGKWPDTFAGRPVPPPPGRSLAPAFAKDASVTHDYFWWYHDGSRAIRVGDWKLVADHESAWELYDLRCDRAESNNLAADHPDNVKQLEAQWVQHTEEFRSLSTRP